MSTHLKELLCHHKMKCVECIKEVHDKIITITNSILLPCFRAFCYRYNPVWLLYCCVHMTYVLATRYLYSSTSSHHFIYVSMFRDRVLFPPFSLGQKSRVESYRRRRRTVFTCKMYVCTLSCWSLFVPLYPTYRTCFKEFRPPVFLRNRYLWHRLKTQ